MGKVRNLTIKKFSRALIEKFPEKFSQDFEENKKILAEVAEISSKKMRNQIAGYVTSLLSRTSEEDLQESSVVETAKEA